MQPHMDAMGGDSDGDEDDYMSMVISESKQTVKETSIQRAARKKREVRISYVARHIPRSATNRYAG
jgi:hypothetical protein